MRILNTISARDAQAIRDRIAGKPLPPAVAKPKRSQPVKCYVSQFHKFDPAKNAHTVQLPLAFNREAYNAMRTPWYLREKWVKETREMVWLALHAYFPRMRGKYVRFARVTPRRVEYVRAARQTHRETAAIDALQAFVDAPKERARVRSMEFVRIAINKLDERDNLPAAFKATVDATASFLVWGGAAPAHVKTIGTADDKLEQRGVTWTYRQQKCESNPRLYGIRIILHCAPRTTE